MLGLAERETGTSRRTGRPQRGPPKATDTATISATGPAYTVTIDTADVAKSLTENSASATVDDAGSLTLSGTFTLSAGTFILGPGGTLSGGTTKLTGGTFVCDGGTLSGVTYDGTLDLSESGRKCPTRPRHGGEQRRRHGRGDDQRHRRMAALFILTIRRRSTARRSISAARLVEAATSSNVTRPARGPF